MERTGRHHHQHQVLASLGTEETQARVRTAACALPLSPGERGVAPPTQQRAPVTVALGGLAPDALWLAHPDVAGGAWAVASVTRVQGHRAQPGAIESQGGVLHLAGGAAVHLCKDMVARPCTAGPCLAARCSDPPEPLAPRAACHRWQNWPPGAAQRSPSPPSPGPCWALPAPAPTRPAHLPGTGVLCTLLGSGRRSLCPGPRRCPHSCTGSGSRGRGLQGRGDPIVHPCPPEASAQQWRPASHASSASRPRGCEELPLTYLTVPP